MVGRGLPNPHPTFAKLVKCSSVPSRRQTTFQFLPKLLPTPLPTHLPTPQPTPLPTTLTPSQYPTLAGLVKRAVDRVSPNGAEVRIAADVARMLIVARGKERKWSATPVPPLALPGLLFFKPHDQQVVMFRCVWWGWGGYVCSTPRVRKCVGRGGRGRGRPWLSRPCCISVSVYVLVVFPLC